MRTNIFTTFGKKFESVCRPVTSKKIMTEAMSMVKFSSYVFTVLMMTINNENEKKMVEASAAVCLPRPWCETNYQES